MPTRLTHNPFAAALQPLSGRPAPWTPDPERAQAMALVDLRAAAKPPLARNAAGRLIDAHTKRFVR